MFHHHQLHLIHQLHDQLQQLINEHQQYFLMNNHYHNNINQLNVVI